MESAALSAQMDMDVQFLADAALRFAETEVISGSCVFGLLLYACNRFPLARSARFLGTLAHSSRLGISRHVYLFGVLDQSLPRYFLSVGAVCGFFFGAENGCTCLGT